MSGALTTKAVASSLVRHGVQARTVTACNRRPWRCVGGSHNLLPTATTATDPDRRRTSATVHAAATSLAWTSVTPEKRKVGGSTPPLTTIFLADRYACDLGERAAVLLSRWVCD